MHSIVPVQSEVINATSATAADLLASKKKAMKRLTCRKCEGHGLQAILKGHAGVCPFKDCSCGTCSSVMSMRANALIRRFRHRQPNQSMAVVKALRSKNGNMRLRIVPRTKNEESMMENTGTLVTYMNDKNGHHTYTTVSTPSIRRSSIMTVQSDDRDSVVSTPPTTGNNTPSNSPPLLSPCPDMDTSEAMQIDPLLMLKARLLQQFITNPSSVNPAIITFLLQQVPTQPAPLNFDTLPNPPILFPTFLTPVPSL